MKAERSLPRSSFYRQVQVSSARSDELLWPYVQCRQTVADATAACCCRSDLSPSAKTDPVRSASARFVGLRARFVVHLREMQGLSQSMFLQLFQETEPAPRTKWKELQATASPVVYVRQLVFACVPDEAHLEQNGS